MEQTLEIGMTPTTNPTPQDKGGEGDEMTFQERVQPWMMACFGEEIAADRLERSDRFIEEALELIQASNYPKERAHELVEYVYGRDQGEINQEVGGVMVTLAAHCLAYGVDMHKAAETELARIWTKVEQIRAKQAAKPRGSALPIAVNSHSTLTEETARLKERVRVLEGELKKIRSVIPLNFLIAHDTPGATGPTDALDLVGAIRSLVHNARKWEARARSALHTTPEVGE